jgi:hypothetical protein
MTVYWSLGYFKETGYGITGFCDNRDCRHTQALDLDVLIGAFGADFIIPNAHDRFVSKLKCSSCGGRRISIIIVPPGGIGQITGH